MGRNSWLSTNPSTGLDPGARRDLWQLLEEIRAADGVTVLLTSHILEEVERADRVAILERGTLVALGTPRALKESVGGDVLTIATTSPERLSAAIAAQLRASAGGAGRQRASRGRCGPDLVREVLTRFGAEVEAVTLAKPTLEDVFIRVTGHRFWGGAGEDA